MAASKDPAAYPVSFRLLLDHFAEGYGTHPARPVKQTLTGKQASTLRFTFYSYKKALKASGDAANFAVANSIVVKILASPHNDQATIEFSLRDEESCSMGLEAAIMAAQGGIGQAQGGTPRYPPPDLPAELPADEAPNSDDVVSRYLMRGT